MESTCPVVELPQHRNSSLNAQELADRMLGHRLRTKQASERGLVVNKVYVTEHVQYEKEFYLSFAVDRTQSKPAIVVSRSGGMNVEEAAEKDPDSIIAASILRQGHYKERYECYRKGARPCQRALYRAVARDGVPPTRNSPSTMLRAFDSQSSPSLGGKGEDKDLLQALAASHGFAYVFLDGTIGNIANGAGIAMATMDAIAYYGGTCANFLDAGGKATKETMVNALRLVLSDERVKVFFINIYGGTSASQGIIRGPVVAEALIDALKEISESKIPLVVRLQGTDSAEGRKIVSRFQSQGTPKTSSSLPTKVIAMAEQPYKMLTIVD
ncbi:beta-succinyl synthetase precursor [Fusarium agapanthi]|uniref:Beta-succinyl synthetase n=1 Tax=Fusarium agapanthi TaxID=1803897 RepID=A0A9P5BEJ4_9HYPO|nr:beta-succinyl synthetase precursor [Fusarium agapanthi]